MSTPVFPTIEESVHARSNGDMTAEIYRHLRTQLGCYVNAGPEEITRRLHELDEEWSIERVAQAGLSGATIMWVTLSLLRRRFLILPALVAAGFLLQSAIRGWNPPMNLLRRLRLRTKHEIEEERYALKVLRGDFNDLAVLPQNENEKVNRILEIIRR